MLRRIGSGGIAVLLALSWSQSSMAQASCEEIEFSDEIMDRYPNAPDACLDVVERDDGRQYAHFQARITRVRGDEVHAEFRRPDGDYGQPISFTPSSEARVNIQGRSYRYRELSRGQELDVYVPPDLWAVAVHEEPEADFATAQAVTTVPIQEPSEEVASLPSTASGLPWLVVLGCVFLALGLILAAARYRSGASRT